MALKRLLFIVQDPFSVRASFTHEEKKDLCKSFSESHEYANQIW